MRRLAVLIVAGLALGCAREPPVGPEPSGEGADADGRADDPGGSDGGARVDGPPIRVGAVAVDLPGSLQNPCWAPDGSRLIFTRFRDGYNEGLSDLVLISSAGAQPALLTTADAQNVNLPGACWSPGRSRIVYSSDDADRDEVWTIAPEGARPSG
jgi:TolB protein